MSGVLSGLPEGRRGRVLAVGLLVAVVLAAWASVIAPLVDWHAAREEHLRQQATLAERMGQLAASLPMLERRASDPAATTVPVLEGNTDAVAGAALQQTLQQVGAQAGATLTSLEILPGETRGAFRRIGVRVSVTATWPVVVRLMQAVVRSSPPLLIDDLQVQSARLVAGGADPLLSTSMVVFGFRAGPS